MGTLLAYLAFILVLLAVVWAVGRAMQLAGVE